MSVAEGSPGAAAKKYASFKILLNHNHAALDAIADMEKLYYSGNPFSLTSVRIKYEELLEAVTGVIYALETLSGKDYSALSNTAIGYRRRAFSELQSQVCSADGQPRNRP